MKKKPLSRKPFLVALGVSLLLNLYFLGAKYYQNIFPPSSPDKFKARVVRVIDGDTFDIDKGERIRLAEIDAPEYPKGCLSKTSKERLEALVLGKEVELEEIGEDSFRRKVCFVKKGKILINMILVEEGLARTEKPKSPYAVLLLDKESEAKELKKGIWSAKCQPKKGCLIKGNVRRDKGTKIYHLPECFNYPKIVIDERKGDRWFCSENEATMAGFRKAEDCPV